MSYDVVVNDASRGTLELLGSAPGSTLAAIDAAFFLVAGRYGEAEKVPFDLRIFLVRKDTRAVYEIDGYRLAPFDGAGFDFAEVLPAA